MNPWDIFGWQLTFGALGAIAFAAFIAGLLGARYPTAPFATTVAILVGDVLLLMAVIGYASSLDCYSSCEWRRSVVFNAALATGFVIGASLIAIVWLGALMSVLARSAVLWVRWARADGETKASLEAGRR